MYRNWPYAMLRIAGDTVIAAWRRERDPQFLRCDKVVRGIIGMGCFSNRASCLQAVEVSMRGREGSLSGESENELRGREDKS